MALITQGRDIWTSARFQVLGRPLTPAHSPNCRRIWGSSISGSSDTSSDMTRRASPSRGDPLHSCGMRSPCRRRMSSTSCTSPSASSSGCSSCAGTADRMPESAPWGRLLGKTTKQLSSWQSARQLGRRGGKRHRQRSAAPLAKPAAEMRGF